MFEYNDGKLDTKAQICMTTINYFLIYEYIVY